MRTYSDLYIGYENFFLEHSGVKHPATIDYYNALNVNKIKQKRIELVSLDLETNFKTSKLMLLGFWEGENYDYCYKNNFIGNLFYQVETANKEHKALCCWNKLDGFELYKQILLRIMKEEQDFSLKKYSKIGGVWNRETKEWTEEPLVKCMLGSKEFGIINVIRGCIQFYYMSIYKKVLNTVWLYDIAPLYPNSLAVEGKRFPYYSKISKKVHLLDTEDWKHFEENEEFRNEVLKSNYLDARVCRDLGYLAQENFKKVYQYYPNTIISFGSLTRAGIVAEINNLHKQYAEGEELKRLVLDDLKSIPIISYYDKWFTTYGQELIKELMCIINESYSGGYIETLKFGYEKEVIITDKVSAYPTEIIKLYDLRNAKITHGNGEPPTILNSYCFIRGDLKTPMNLNFNPITSKHPFSNDTNVRMVGEYTVSYLKESRDLLVKRGCVFTNEFWINIETEGKISPLGYSVNASLKSRKYLQSINDSAEQTAKGISNSAYGITIEATAEYKLFGQDVVKVGYRAGEFYNPIYASVITASVRNIMTEACFEIEDNGGEVLLIMTDSIAWRGKVSDLPEYYYKEEKTVGYFEKPKIVKNFMCMGAGRYEYYSPLSNGKFEKYTGKTRGFSIEQVQDEEGITIEDFNWRKLVNKAIVEKSTVLKIPTRILISPSLISASKKYTVHDLGLVKTVTKKIDILAGKSKRLMNFKEDWLETLKTGMIDTKPLYCFRGMGGIDEIEDFTLPNFRKVIKEKTLINREEKEIITKRKENSSYYKNHKEEIRKKYNLKYALLVKYGFEPQKAKIYANKKWKDVQDLIGKGEVK